MAEWSEYLDEIDRECREFQRYQLANCLKLDLPRFFEKEDPEINIERFWKSVKEDNERLKREQPALWKKIQEWERKAAREREKQKQKGAECPASKIERRLP
jgi:hypothetical protein